MDELTEFFPAYCLMNSSLPKAWWSDLFINGLMAGFNEFCFVLQIMILFLGFIPCFEDTGYMARISFLSDRLMRKVF